jgi:5'-nucleotidase
MKILLANDDGIFSPGLHALEKVLSEGHEVWVVAPDRERSGVSQCITFFEAIKVAQVADQKFAINGTPADCTIVALKGGFVPRPDVVISGINAGPNLGTDVIYSGTVAAARQASLMGIPGIAISLDRYGFDSDFLPAANLLEKHLQNLVQNWKPGFFWNINVPSVLLSDELQEASLCVRRYLDRIESFIAPNGERYCFVVGEIGTDEKSQHNSDVFFVQKGLAAITRVKSQPSVYEND